MGHSLSDMLFRDSLPTSRAASRPSPIKRRTALSSQWQDGYSLQRRSERVLEPEKDHHVELSKQTQNRHEKAQSTRHMVDRIFKEKTFSAIQNSIPNDDKGYNPALD